MAKPVTHLSKVSKIGKDSWRTGTLCNRMSNAGDDLNVTESAAEVTCKFCLKIIDAKRRGQLRATFQAEVTA